MSLTQPHVNDVTRNLEQSSMSMGLLQLLDPRLSPQAVIPDHSPIFPVTKTAVQAVANAAHCTGIGINQDPQRRATLARRHSSTDIRAIHQCIMDDLRELYCCRPDPSIFQRSWRLDAEFENPVCKCKRYGEYAAQWFALPIIFSYSKTLTTRVMSSTDVPNRLVFYQSQEYVTRWFGWKKVINSVIVVNLDEDEKIERLVDQWNGAELPTRFGAQYLRIVIAKVLPWLISFPKTAT